MFLVNVQHDCFRGDCQVSGTQRELQERTQTDRNIAILTHTDDTHFLLNLFILHHYDELIEYVPAHLVGPFSCRHPQEREQIWKAGAAVLRQQNNVRNATRGAVREARTTATARANEINAPPSVIGTENLPQDIIQDAVHGASPDVNPSRPKRPLEPEVEGQALKHRCGVVGAKNLPI